MKKIFLILAFFMISNGLFANLNLTSISSISINEEKFIEEVDCWEFAVTIEYVVIYYYGSRSYGRCFC